MTETETPDINIEEIMKTIRQQVMAQKMVQSGSDRPLLNLEGKRFSPEFYEHLYQAGLAYDQLEVPLFVSQNKIPVLGPLLQWLRGKLHTLILYYVNQMAASQIRANTHLLQAISTLSQELEAEQRES